MVSDLSKVVEVSKMIQTIEIQGATNIAKAGFKTMEDELLSKDFSSYDQLWEFTKKASQLLMSARDTEPMLFNGLKYALSILEVEKNTPEHKLKEVQQRVAQSYTYFLKIIANEKKKRIEIGRTLIDDGDNIVNHCHSSAAVDVIIGAHKEGKKIHVYNTETRPLYQGRITSQDFLKAGVPVTMITDSTAGFFIDNIYESQVHINKVIIGCDAIKLNGNVINKVGSFNIGLSAWHSGIPLYVSGSLLKVDMVDSIEIEQRSGEEVWPDAPEGLEIVNYAFDMIPAKCVTGIVTEFGVIPPWELKRTIKEHYPWMLSEEK